MTDKGRKRIRKSPEERKREIIKAAVNLVGEKGYYGTSLKEIADDGFVFYTNYDSAKGQELGASGKAGFVEFTNRGDVTGQICADAIKKKKK